MIRGSEKLRSLLPLVLSTLDIVLRGCFGVLEAWWCLGAQSLWCKAPGKRRGLQLGCGDCPEQFVRVPVTAPRVATCTGSVTAPKGCHLYGFGDRPQGSLSGITASCIVRGREEITVALVASWGALCLHTALTEISIRKGVNFGIHHRLPVPRLSLTRTLYLCTLLCDSHIVYCHISCYHLVVYLA